MEKCLILFVVVLATANAMTMHLDKAFGHFKAKYSKQYKPHEEPIKMETFVKNLKEIQQHNERHLNGEVSFSRGINEFSDMTADELNAFMRKKVTQHAPAVQTTDKKSIADLPSEVDWRKKGVVSDVKKQGENCVAGWAFAAVGAIEGQDKHGHLKSLSVQNIIDCSTSNGCEGGTVEDAFKYILENGGIEAEESYGYKGEKGDCEYIPILNGAQISNYTMLQKGDENALTEAIATVGPIAVAIDSSLASFHSYKDGIYHDTLCSSENLDHEVLVVGYGTYNKRDYYIVKNSWGKSWGNNGYIKMARNALNHCGIATRAGYATIA